MRNASPLPPPKVALVSVGLGRIRRGFERFFSELFGELSGRMDITLYKAGGPRSERECVPRLLEASRLLASLLPLGGHAGGPAYKRDCLAFGMSLVPDLLTRRFDVVHCIDPPMAKVLLHLKRTLRFSARLLFTEGCATPPEHYPPVTHVHQVAAEPLRVALEAGLPESFLTMIPCGMHSQRFARPLPRTELRAKYGVAESTFVALAVSAVQRPFKRVDYIIEECSRIDGDFLLWIDGNPAEPDLFELARTKLGSRCRVTHVPSSDVHELYQTADVLVHASLDEAFGLAVVEALCSGLPAIAHDSPHFAWLIGDRDWLADMSQPGSMTRLVERARAVDRAQLRRIGWSLSEPTCRRFDWRWIAPEYIELYRKVAAMKQEAH